MQSQGPRRNSALREIVCLVLLLGVHFRTTAGTVSTGSLEQARGDMPTKIQARGQSEGPRAPQQAGWAPRFRFPSAPAFVPPGLGTVCEAGSWGRHMSS